MGTNHYMAKHNLKGNSHLYYGVACEFCGAEAGRSCFQLSLFNRNGGYKKWAPPHSGRIKAANDRLLANKKTPVQGT